MNNKLTEDYDLFISTFEQKLESAKTKEELLTLKERANELLAQYSNLELTVKRDSNSLYGTSANEFFSLKDYNVSTDITMSAKHSTVIVDIAINKFFTIWADNPSIVEKIKSFYPNATVTNNVNYVIDTETDLCNYGDTDSRYIDLGMIYQLINVPIPNDDIELSDFALLIVDNYINNIIADTIRQECEFRNANFGYLKMTHEVTGRVCAYMGKKQYIMTLIWKDGKRINRKLKYTGIELKKGSISPRLKGIIRVVIEKFFIENKKFDIIAKEIKGLFKYIITRQERSLIYEITTVNELDLIKKNENGVYESSKGHIQHKIACFWYNFIENKSEYQRPFEGQKMNWYYDEYGNTVGVPDDVDIDKVKNLPKPDYVRMLKKIFIKNILKYITKFQNADINDKLIDAFLTGIDIQKINK